uniref:Reverse transcriptase domain-containing protein n=1 Tax=Xenopus tropicalis TaxID=8364 RepID=A0A803JK98_XENTR
MSRLPVQPPKRDAFLSIIHSLADSGVIVPVPPTQRFQGFYSNLFIVPKKDGSFRPILDLKKLNRWISYHRFKMESLRSVIRAMEPAEFLASLDIRDAYLHVPIHPHHPEGFHEGHVCDSGSPPCPRCIYHSVLGRPPYQGSFQGTSRTPRSAHHPDPSRIRVDHKLSEVLPITQPTDDLPGSPLRHSTTTGLLTRGETAQATSFYPPPQDNDKADSTLLHESPGTHGVGHRGSPICPVSPSPTPVTNSQEVAQTIPSPTDLLTAKHKEISFLVAPPPPAISGADIHRTDLASSHDRCQPPGMGSDLSGEISSGSLVPGGIPTADQPSGDQGHTPGTPVVAGPSQAQTSAHPDGQRHRLHQSAGGHAKHSGQQGSNSHSDLGRTQHTSPVRHTHPRSVKPGSRLPKQTPSRPRGVGTPPRRIPSPSGPVGHATDRPNGHKAQQKGPHLPRKVPGPPCGRHRCNDHSVALPASLHLPSPPHAPTGTKEDKQRNSHSHSSRPVLAQEILVLRSASALPGTSSSITTARRPSQPGPDPAPQPTTLHLNGLALEASILRDKGLSETVIQTMLRARKPSTSRIYHRTWNCYWAWCDQRDLNFRECNIPTVLDFLQSGLHKGLRLGSLKSQISALSILFQERIAHHNDIRTFLQGVSRIKPPFRHPVPPWDLNLVLNALTEPPFEPLDSADLCVLTWKTVFLIAISSIRRVSELSALSCSPPFLIFQEDRAVLRTAPGFLPKVVSPFHINTEISLPSFCNKPSNEKEAKLHRLDVVRALKTYVSRTKSFRRSDTLFVLPSGPRKGLPATKTTLARWIKEAIRRSYLARRRTPPLRLRAHSTRELGASWAHRHMASADQVCKAATWASLHTFTKFYQFNTYLSAEAALGRKILQAAVSTQVPPSLNSLGIFGMSHCSCVPLRRKRKEDLCTYR